MSTTTLGTRAATPPTRSPSRRGPNHRWVVLAIGVAAQASFAAAFSGIPVTAPTLRGDYHFSIGQLGVVMAAILLGIAVSEIPWGIWTDRLGERKVLLTGLLSTGGVLAAMAAGAVPTGSWLPGVWVVALGMLMVGILGGSVNGSSGRAVMAWFKDGQRGFAMSIRQTAIPAGGAVGAVLLPWLAESLGFRAVFGVLAGFCFVTAAATWRWMHQPELDDSSQASSVGNAAPAAENPSPLRRLDVWRLALASGLLTVPQFAVLTFATVFLVDNKHAALLVGSLTILAVQVGGAIARVWSGRWTDRHGGRRGYVRLIGVASAVALAGAAVFTHAPTPVIAVALAIGGLLASAWHGVAYTEIAHMAGADRAGTALGLENTTVFAAAFATPLLISLLLGVSSWPLIWALAGICSLLAVPLIPRRNRQANSSHHLEAAATITTGSAGQ